jgi:predicted MPP superfamily phosphohydrolase
MIRELDQHCELQIQDQTGHRVSGADVVFFVDGEEFSFIPSTRDRNPRIQIPLGHKISARVRYGASFAETIEFGTGEHEERTVTIPGIAERLGILHLTDLHVGQSEQADYFPGIKQAFFDDLRQCHKTAGPWDLLVFSGDLAFSGQREQFTELNEFLKELWHVLVELGSNPVFLAVPGNHDLSRPADKKDPVVQDFKKLASLSGKAGAKIWDAITKDAKSGHRKAVDAMFANYTRWWTPWAKLAKERLEFRKGLMPGEFAATLVKGHCRFAFAGLNASVLQASGGDFQGKLAINVRQFNTLVPKSSKGSKPWPEDCDAALLITHQPPDWLSADNLQNVFEPFIARAGRFALHLCGHMHVAKGKVEAGGGSEARRVALGRSLFAMEPVDGKNMERLFGYAAYQVHVSKLKKDGFVRAWPRKATKTGGGNWVFDRDVSFDLDQDGATRDVPANYFQRPNV